ncbi:MAG: hypothetical protein O3C07_02045, partial [Bacteroidetes bacterium]|nr:hypothetical protein [Bacteroidota bacterium]
YSEEDLKALIKIIEDQPDKTMTEYAQLLGRKLNRPPMSQSNIQRIMAKLGYTRKKKSKYAKEQDTQEIKKKRGLSASP